MSIVIEDITSAFPDYRSTLKKRPDGGYLLILEKNGEQLKRVIPAPRPNGDLRLEWIISALRRDIDMSAGRTPKAEGLQSQSGFCLPTYSA